MSLNLSANPKHPQQNITGKTSSVSTLINLTQWTRNKISNSKSDQLVNRHARLLAVLPAGVIVIDANGSVEEANQAAVQLLGEPLIAQRWVDIIDRAFDPKPDDGHDISLKSGRLVHISTNPLDGEPGQLILIQDVTETRLLQNKVSQLQRISTIGDTAAHLAHQIRTPLASALLSLSPLLKSAGSEQIRERAASRVKESLVHMEQLIKDLLSFSRGELASPSPVSLKALLADIENKFQSQPEAENLHLNIDSKRQDCLLYGSHAALVSAVNNLINNAQQAGSSRVDVVVSEREESHQQLIISIKDNGKGMTAEQCQKVLTPFYTTKANGNGLGLAVVDNIIKAHKGHLSIESQPGQGSVFNLHLPVYHPPFAAQMPAFNAEETSL